MILTLISTCNGLGSINDQLFKPASPKYQNPIPNGHKELSDYKVDYIINNYLTIFHSFKFAVQHVPRNHRKTAYKYTS